MRPAITTQLLRLQKENDMLHEELTRYRTQCEKDELNLKKHVEVRNVDDDF